MHYVISDIHGHSREFFAMLEKIRFCERDYLVVNGDIIDRGNDPISVMRYLHSAADNIVTLRGNHEQWLVDFVDKYGFYDYLRNAYEYNSYRIMLSALNESERDIFISWMRELPLVHDVTAGGREFVISHGQPPMQKDYGPWDVLMDDSDFYVTYQNHAPIPGKTCIVGHYPVKHLAEELKLKNNDGRIWHNADGSLYDIDCGCAYPGEAGLLGCLCLETMEEYYVDCSEYFGRDFI